MDGTIGGVEYVDSVVAVIGVHPDAEVLFDPGQVAGLHIGDRFIPDRNAFLLTPNRCNPILKAIGDEHLLVFERGIVGLRRRVKSEADDHGQRESGKRQHGQCDLTCQWTAAGA